MFVIWADLTVCCHSCLLLASFFFLWLSGGHRGPKRALSWLVHVGKSAFGNPIVRSQLNINEVKVGPVSLTTSVA